VLQRLLLLPLLSPLLAVLLVAAVNPKPWLRIRLLTWTSPTWPMAGWIAAAAGLGAAISSAGTALALQDQGLPVLPRRQVRRGSGSDTGSNGQEAAGQDDWVEEPAAPSAWAGPARSAGEPAPTVSVPFRVIRKGSANQTAPNAKASTAASQTSTTSDDWNAPVSDAW